MTLGKLFTHTHTRDSVNFGTAEGLVILCGYECNVGLSESYYSVQTGLLLSHPQAVHVRHRTTVIVLVSEVYILE